MRYVVLLSLCATALMAQEPPRRPRLPDGADTNSARLYYQFGEQQLRNRPRDAAAAFYWVTRLEPASPDGWFAQFVAQLLTDEARLWSYMDGDRATLARPDVQRLDSLVIRAAMLDPLFFRGLGSTLGMTYLRRRLARELRSAGFATNETAIQDAIQQWSDRIPWEAARLAYGRGDFRAAATYWASALLLVPRAYPWHAERARAFYHQNLLDSAAAGMRKALEDARTVDTQVVRYLYDSKAEWEYAIGRIEERRGNLAGAREGYERALVEDLGYWMGHVRLGLLALRTADTTRALTELGRAASDAGGEYVAHLLLGEALVNAGQPDSAVGHLETAVRLEPWAAVPHRLLGAAHLAGRRTAEARRAFERYVALARRDDPQLAAVRERLAGLP